MILVDTSVWVDHLRVGDASLSQALQSGAVLIHPFIIGELACGNLKDRDALLSLLGALPRAPLVDEQEVLFFISRQKLMGRGVGYIDIHLLASAVITGGAKLWTRDTRLHAMARELGLAYSEAH